jgi:hypothetical protein
MKKKTEHNKQIESEALRLHREAYQKRLKRLRELDEPVTDKAADESEETERDAEEEALLTNA